MSTPYEQFVDRNGGSDAFREQVPPRVVCPTVNVNGTSRQALTKQYLDVVSALDKLLINAMPEAAPHGRDYPTGGYTAARDQYAARVKMLMTLREDYMILAQHVYKTGGSEQ